MARCECCGKRGFFLSLDNMGYCPICATTRIQMLEAEARKRREENDRRIKEQWIAEEARRRQETERSTSLSKPFAPPRHSKGFWLAYSYTEVGFYCPDECREFASSVPPHKQLAMGREPDNKYDADAITLLYEGRKIGYMNKGKLRDMLNDYAISDEKDFLPVSRFWTEKPTFDLFFYRSARSLINEIGSMPGHKFYTLASNRNDSMQEMLGLTEVGEIVSISYDDEKDRYLATCDGCDVGYFPASASSFLEEHFEYVARIASITQNDSGIYVAKVVIAPK